MEGENIRVNSVHHHSPGTSSSSSSTVAIGAFPSAAVTTEKFCEKLEEYFISDELDLIWRATPISHTGLTKQKIKLWIYSVIKFYITGLVQNPDIITSFSNCYYYRLLTLLGQCLRESPEARQTVGSQLVQDARQHLGQLLGLSVAGDGEGVGCEGGLHFGVVEMDDCPLICKHVNLLTEQSFTPLTTK